MIYYLSFIYTYIIGNTITNNRFPEDMKKAEISPIFKTKDDMIKVNYRPISILAVFIFQGI